MGGGDREEEDEECPCCSHWLALAGNTFAAPRDFFSPSHVPINISAGRRVQRQRRIIPEAM